MWGNSLQMFLMTPHGECMCALIDFMLAIQRISIKAFNGGIFYHCGCFDCNIDLLWMLDRYTESSQRASMSDRVKKQVKPLWLSWLLCIPEVILQNICRMKKNRKTLSCHKVTEICAFPLYIHPPTELYVNILGLCKIGKKVSCLKELWRNFDGCYCQYVLLVSIVFRWHSTMWVTLWVLN